MLILISYDVSLKEKAGQARLRHISKECLNYGKRVQNSVFECNIDYQTYLKLKDRLLEIIDKEEDSLRFYNLGTNYKTKVEHFGIKPSYDPDEALII
jgi:CRISPR-associated endoribonuclease Cas2